MQEIHCDKKNSSFAEHKGHYVNFRYIYKLYKIRRYSKLGFHINFIQHSFVVALLKDFLLGKMD